MQRTLRQVKRVFGFSKPPAPKGNTIKKATPMGAYSNSQARDNAAPVHAMDCDMDPQLTERLSLGYPNPRQDPVNGHVEALNHNSDEPERRVTGDGSSHMQQLPSIAEEDPAWTEVPRNTSPVVAADIINPPNDLIRPASSHGWPGRCLDTSSLTHGQAPEQSPQQQQATLNLLLGQQDNSSQYFTQRYFRMPDPDRVVPSSFSTQSGDRESLLLALPELDPQPFELYNVYMHTGKVPVALQSTYYPLFGTIPEHAWQACWPLMNAHILGCIIDEPDFADYIMDTLISKIPPNACADRATIAHLFSNGSGHGTHVLRKLIIGRCLDAGLEYFNVLNVRTLPSSFLHLSLEEALRRLSRDTVETNPDCLYHIHKSPEDCYKRKITPSQRRQGTRLQSTQDLSRKDAARVLKDAAQNEVSVIDWGQQKTYGGLVSPERIRAKQIDRTSPRASVRAPGPDMKRKEITSPMSPSPSSQFPQPEKLPLRISAPLQSPSMQATRLPDPDMQRILPLEPSVPTSVLAELQGSTVAGQQADAIGPGIASSYGGRWAVSGESAAGHDNKPAATVESRKWPGAYPESVLGGE